MGIGVSVFLIAVGAILAFAVNVTTSGIDLSMVGVILMVVGIIGLLISVTLLNGWGYGGPRTTAVVDDEFADPGVRRRVVRRRSYID